MRRKEAEIYWLDDKSPKNLERRAVDFECEGHLGLADQMRQRADQLKSTPPGDANA